jgi:hypothetical protein
MTNYNRPRGAVGILLDNEILLAGIRAAYPEDIPEDAIDRVDGPQLLLKTGQGWAVIGTEGVGYYESEGTIAIYYAVSPLGMFTTYDTPIAAVLAARTAETIDLADHIRVFGSRLDSNHGLWFRAVAEATK